MSGQFSAPKQSGRLWSRCLAVYCCALFLILLGLLIAESCLEEPAIELSAYEAFLPSSKVILIGINSSSPADLQTLPRIGPVLAQAIVDYRTEHGPFQSPEQLLEVPGIGEKTLEQLRPLICLD